MHLRTLRPLFVYATDTRRPVGLVIFTLLHIWYTILAFLLCVFICVIIYSLF